MPAVSDFVGDCFMLSKDLELSTMCGAGTRCQHYRNTRLVERPIYTHLRLFLPLFSWLLLLHLVQNRSPWARRGSAVLMTSRPRPDSVAWTCKNCDDHITHQWSGSQMRVPLFADVLVQ